MKKLINSLYRELKALITHVRYLSIKKSIPWKIVDPNQTVAHIYKNHVSVSRFGEGELYIIWGIKSPFQDVDPLLVKRLKEVLDTPISNHIVCLPHSFINSEGYIKSTKRFIENLVVKYFSKLKQTIDSTRIYYDTNFTRFYHDFRDKRHCAQRVKEVKKIWDNLDLYIIEGQSTRFGVGNDLLDNAKSVHRILCPAVNAFSKYDEILSAAKTVPSSSVIICALGMTATVLAYDLAKAGFWAIDIGHLDIEYEWYRMGAKEKCPVKSKAVNEAGYQTVQNLPDDEKYKLSIINVIL